MCSMELVLTVYAAMADLVNLWTRTNQKQCSMCLQLSTWVDAHEHGVWEALAALPPDFVHAHTIALILMQHSNWLNIHDHALCTSMYSCCHNLYMLTTQNQCLLQPQHSIWLAVDGHAVCVAMAKWVSAYSQNRSNARDSCRAALQLCA